MKKIIWGLLAGGFLLACKKDKPDASRLMPGKIYENSLLKTEYLYTLDKKPYRRNSYATVSGTSQLSYYRIYSYNDKGLLIETAEYNKNNTFQGIFKLQYNVNNLVSRIDLFAFDLTPIYSYLMTYNAAGNLTFVGTTDASAKKVSDMELYYDAAGKLERTKRYHYVASSRILSDTARYFFNDHTLPASWQFFELQPYFTLANYDRSLYDITLDSIHYYYSDAPPFTTTYINSGKMYNGAGLVTLQQVSYKANNGITTSSGSKEYKYEYVE